MKVNEIFKSIQGETTFQGVPSLFIRTTGCNLRCNWCDTRYAYDDGTDYTVDEILKIVGKYQYKYVVITGGEPLTQKEV
ncbi:MAG: radical SAM protein, partial [Nitrospirae bacterium]|nr:radical SAM protein [Nitrospirota bacterium]